VAAVTTPLITGTVVGAENVQANLRGVSDRMHAELVTGIGRAALAVQRFTKETQLSGAVLNVRTGNLRRSINVSQQESRDSITATVGTNVKYGAAWELGFSRRIGAGARGGKPDARRPLGTKDYPARSFLRTALEAMRPTIRAEFEAAVQRALK
jgi:phage gpG-like protein